MTVIRSCVPRSCFGYRPIDEAAAPATPVEGDDRFPEAKVPATQVLQPGIVRDPDIVVQTRKDANKKRQLAAQLPNKVLAAIYDHLDRHPDASNNMIAEWLKRDSEIAPLVAHLKPRSLADKIGELRPR
jgi:hypothetical protein